MDEMHKLDDCQEHTGANTPGSGAELQAALYSIAATANDPADLLGAIADVALDHILGLLGLEAGAVFLCDENVGRLHVAAHRCLPEKFTRGAPKLTTEAAEYGVGIERNSQIRIEPVSRYPRLAGLLSEPCELTTFISAPLVIAGESLGGLVVFGHGEQQLEPEDAARLELVAGQVATLIKNAQVLATERRGRRLAENLQQVANALVSNLDRETILASILEHLSQVMEYDGAAVLLLQDGLLKTVSAKGFGSQEAVAKIMQVSLVPDDHKYLRRIIREGKPFHFPPEHRQDPFRGVLAMKTIHSTMAAPLKARGAVIGVLTAHKIESHWYDDADLATLAAFGSHAALAIQNAELWTEVQQHSQELKALSAQYVEALERERHRISRELHDEVGQALTVTRISLEMALRDVPAELTTVRSRVKEVVALASQTLNDVRRLAYALRPTVLDDLGLVAALQWYTDAFSQRTGLPVSFQASGLVERPSADVEIVLYRLVQEGLTNVVRHAHARHVEIELTGEPQVVSLRIRDDGEGFDATRLSEPWSPGQGLGLRGMRERVGLLGGSLQVESQPGKGAELYVRVPLKIRS